SLVCMDALDVNIKERIGIDGDVALAMDVLREALLSQVLDPAPAILKDAVVGVGFQASESLQIPYPIFADRLVQKRGKGGIRQSHEPSRRDTVGLVPELFRPHVMEVSKHRVLEQFGVELGNAIDCEASDASQIGHSHASGAVAITFVDQRHAGDPCMIVDET